MPATPVLSALMSADCGAIALLHLTACSAWSFDGRTNLVAFNSAIVPYFSGTSCTMQDIMSCV